VRWRVRYSYTCTDNCQSISMNEFKSQLMYFPFAVTLKNKKVLVVGGGKVAERKVLSLYQAGAFVSVVSPHLTDELKSLVDEDRIRWIPRNVQKRDINGVRIIIAATNDSHVNQSVSRWAKEKCIWINVVDKPILSDFISPAVFHSEEAIIAVYTDGRNPVLSRDVKNFLKERWNEFLSYRNKLQNDFINK